MENSIGKDSNLNSFARLFFEKYPEPITLRDMGNGCLLLRQALENKKWEIVKAYFIIRHWYTTSYCNKQPDQKFWPDLQTDFEQTIQAYERRFAHKLTWTYLLYAELKFARSRHQRVAELNFTKVHQTRKYVKSVLKCLIDDNIITLNDTIHRVKIFFMAFDLGAKFQDVQLKFWDCKVRKVVHYTESLECHVATMALEKSDRLKILNFLAKRNALTLEPSGLLNISAPFELIQRNNIAALKPFLSHPKIHKLKDSNGRTILHYMAKAYPMLSFMNNFSLEQLKYMLKQREHVAVWNRTAKESPVDQLRISVARGLAPAKYLRAIKELLVEGELHDCDFVASGAEFYLGVLGRFLLVDSGVRLDSLKSTIENYAKAVRKNEASTKELISPGDTTFDFEALPVEIAHLIFTELDYESSRSILCVSKAIFGLKTKFSDAMYNEHIRKEFPMNTNYGVKGKKGYFELAKRYTNWKNGAFNIRSIEWSKTTPRSEARFFTLDENWLAFRTDVDFKLWDCHNDEIHALPGFTIESTTSLAYLESHPGQYPVIAGFSLSQYEIIVQGRSARKAFKTSAVAGDGGLFVESIDNDRVFVGGKGQVYSIEKEQQVGQFQDESHYMLTGQFNPLNNLIFAQFGSYNGPYHSVVMFNKDCQKVESIRLQASIEDCRFVDEHSFVTRAAGSTGLWDLRKVDSPVKVIDFNIDRIFCNRYALRSNSDQRLAVVWDLKTAQWETSIILPDNIRYRPICNSRYAIWETFKPEFCVLDFQT